MRFIIFTVLLVVGTACGPSEETRPKAPERVAFTKEFGSADGHRMDVFVRQLVDADIPFQQSRREGITVISWQPPDDERVRRILCDIFPPPPPNDRSVAMSSPELMTKLKRAMRENSVEFESQMYAGIEFLVFDPHRMNHVRSVFFDTFGYEMSQGPSLEIVTELMQCKEVQTRPESQ